MVNGKHSCLLLLLKVVATLMQKHGEKPYGAPVNTACRPEMDLYISREQVNPTLDIFITPNRQHYRTAKPNLVPLTALVTCTPPPHPHPPPLSPPSTALLLMQAATSNEGDQTAVSTASSVTRHPNTTGDTKQSAAANGPANGDVPEDKASQQSLEAARKAELARREAKAGAGAGKGQPQAALGPPQVGVVCCNCSSCYLSLLHAMPVKHPTEGHTSHHCICCAYVTRHHQENVTLHLPEGHYLISQFTVRPSIVTVMHTLAI